MPLKFINFTINIADYACSGNKTQGILNGQIYLQHIYPGYDNRIAAYHVAEWQKYGNLVIGNEVMGQTFNVRNGDKAYLLTIAMGHIDQDDLFKFSPLLAGEEGRKIADCAIDAFENGNLDQKFFKCIEQPTERPGIQEAAEKIDERKEQHKSQALNVPSFGQEKFKDISQREFCGAGKPEQ